MFGQGTTRSINATAFGPSAPASVVSTVTTSILAMRNPGLIFAAAISVLTNNPAVITIVNDNAT